MSIIEYLQQIVTFPSSGTFGDIKGLGENDTYFVKDIFVEKLGSTSFEIGHLVIFLLLTAIIRFNDFPDKVC